MNHIKLFELFGKHEDLIRLTEEEYEEEISMESSTPLPKNTIKSIKEIYGGKRNYPGILTIKKIGKWEIKIEEDNISYFSTGILKTYRKNGIIVDLECKDEKRQIDIFYNDDEYYITNVLFYEFKNVRKRPEWVKGQLDQDPVYEWVLIQLDDPEMYKCDGIDGLLDFIREVASW